MKKKYLILAFIHSLWAYDVEKLHHLIIEHFDPHVINLKCVRYLAIGGCISRLFVYYLKDFTHHHTIIKIAEKRPYILGPPGMIYSHHIAFGGKIGTIRATFIQEIAFYQENGSLHAYDATGKTFSINLSDPRIN